MLPRFLTAVSLAVVCVTPTRVHAQVEDTNPPVVTIVPGSGIYTAPTSMQITIEWCDSQSRLQSSSRKITLNGVGVDSAFTYQGASRAGCYQFARSVGTLTFSGGTQTLRAEIKDFAMNVGVGFATYTPKTYTVAVTPNGQATSQPAFSGATQQFGVNNTGNQPGTYDLAVTCAPPAAHSCSVQPSVTLQPGVSTNVPVSYSTGAVGSAGTIRLNATHRDYPTNSDDGSIALTVSAGAPATTIVSVDDANAGTSVERDLCLSVSLGSASAFECGDLRVAHALPSVRTVNSLRTPTLLYTSRFAVVSPIVAANVTLAAGAQPPTKVSASLWIYNGSSWVNPTGATGEWEGDDFLEGRPTRIALSYSAAGDGTKLVDYRVDVTVWNGGTPQPTVSAYGKLILVDRSQSPLGAGWWLAGLEQLLFASDASILWVGGDGSTRRYTATGIANTWSALPVDRPDTLKWDATRGRYVRYLAHGLKVEFNSIGQHVATVNRLDYTTTFEYDGSGRPWKITVPKWSGPTYVFDYDTPDTVRITAPPAAGLSRQITIGKSGGAVRSIKDADATIVNFEYDGAPNQRRMNARVNRRGAKTRFTYATGHVLDYASLDSDPGVPWREHRFAPVAETQGLGVAGLILRAVPSADAHTKYDGPRIAAELPDHTYFWVNRFGSPWKIQNAVGAQTLITRGDGRFPALVTELRAPNAFTTWGTYTARGNPQQTTQVNPLSDGRNASAHYKWDDKWDFVNKVTLPHGEFTAFEYDAWNGNRLWQEDGRGYSSRVTFSYYEAGNPAVGLLRATNRPGNIRDSVAYDAALANVSGVRTPMGYWTRIIRDAIGRDSVARVQINVAGPTCDAPGGACRDDTLHYDLKDRVTRSVAFGPYYSLTPAQRLIVRTEYDAEGGVRRVERESAPNPTNLGVLTTQWVRDTVDRWVVEVAPDGERDSTVFDAAANAVKVFTRRRDQTGNRYMITMQYDTLNRLVQRTVPPVYYPVRNEGIATEIGLTGLSLVPYGDLTVSGEVARFWYNPTSGQLDSAVNEDAKIKRAYYANGAVKWDSLRIRTFDGVDFDQHRYGLDFQYDLNGRRISLQHPENLAGRAGGNVYNLTTYTYDPNTGLLSTVRDPMGNVFTYNYNTRNEIESVRLPWGTHEQFTYDADGQTLTHKLGTLRSTTYTYDARGLMVRSENAVQQKDKLILTHSGLGYLIRSEFTTTGLNTSGNQLSDAVDSRFWYDPLGNRYSESHTYNAATRTTSGWWVAGAGGSVSYTNPGGAGFSSTTGRQTFQDMPYRRDRFRYDAGGNVDFSFTELWWDNPDTEAPPPREDRALFYAADGKLRRADYRWVERPQWENAAWHRVEEEYRYDPLGRRILVRTWRTCQYLQPFGCRLGLIRRTVWDGDSELYEIQMPGDAGQPASRLENDTEAVNLAVDQWPTYFDRNPFFGRVAYTYGLALDQPLSITRINYESNPFQKGGWASWDPFTVVPHWNARGEADLGSFANGQTSHCRTPPGMQQRCADVYWTRGIHAYQREDRPWVSWHGTLVEQKADGARTIYRRNRYYDPHSGRFTQEDPIGLAGGPNLYGFASGDPANFSDPFGLFPLSMEDPDPKPSFWDRIKKVWKRGNFIRRIITELMRDPVETPPPPPTPPAQVEPAPDPNAPASRGGTGGAATSPPPPPPPDPPAGQGGSAAPGGRGAPPGGSGGAAPGGGGGGSPPSRGGPRGVGPRVGPVGPGALMLIQAILQGYIYSQDMQRCPHCAD